MRPAIKKVGNSGSLETSNKKGILSRLKLADGVPLNIIHTQAKFFS